MSFFRGETVSIISKTIDMNDLNDFGLPTETTTTRVVKNVLVAFTSTDTYTSVEEQALKTNLTLYFPAGTNINDEDVFIIRNTKWEKTGRQEDFQTDAIIGSFLNVGVIVNVKQHKGNVE
jgi:hypothetical protein